MTTVPFQAVHTCDRNQNAQKNNSMYTHFLADFAYFCTHISTALLSIPHRVLNFVFKWSNNYSSHFPNQK